MNMWSIVHVTTTTGIGCTSASLSWGRIARGNQTRLPVPADAIVYRPQWFQPTMFEGSAEPYNPDDRSLRARLRRVPPPPDTP